MNKHFKGLRTLGMFVTDLKAATEWYTQVLETPPYFNEPFYVGFNISGYELGLQPAEISNELNDASTYTYWGVEDIHKEYARLIALGAKAHSEPTNVGGELMVATVTDPWNNIIGLIYNPYFKAAGEMPALKEPKATAPGGIFFKSKNPDKLKAWYQKHLGIVAGEYGGAFEWKKPDNTPGFTAWSPFKEDTTYFDPGKQNFMINYRVHDLENLIKNLREADVEIVGEIEAYEYGQFGWILDCDGNKVELWEPNDEVYDKLTQERNISR